MVGKGRSRVSFIHHLRKAADLQEGVCCWCVESWARVFQVETLPATHIRGKCTVTLLNETESLLSYLNKEVSAPTAFCRESRSDPAPPLPEKDADSLWDPLSWERHVTKTNPGSRSGL